MNTTSLWGKAPSGASNKSEEQYYSTLKLPTHMIALYGTAYGLIFLIGVVGNVMVVLVVIITPRMHSVTNLFISNLALADILVAVFCIPMTLLDNIFTGWPFGEILCKMTPYVQGVSICASVYNLATIAFDRFLAICFHPRWRIMKCGACATLVLIWMFSLCLMLPWAVYYEHVGLDNYKQTIYVCQPVWPDFDSRRAFYVVAIFLGTYLLPLSVVFTCYILIAWRVWHRRAPGVVVGNCYIKRCKMNVVKMLVTVVLMFALSWLPLHVFHLVLYFDTPTDREAVEGIINIGLPLAQWLGLSNSGMNSFIYTFFSGNFRRGFKNMWYCITRRKRHFRNNAMSRNSTRTLSEDSAMLTRCSMTPRNWPPSEQGSWRSISNPTTGRFPHSATSSNGVYASDVIVPARWKNKLANSSVIHLDHSQTYRGHFDLYGRMRNAYIFRREKTNRQTQIDTETHREKEGKSER